MVDLKKLSEDVNRVKDAGFLHSALTCDEAIEIIEKFEVAQKDAARYQWLRDKSGAESAIENYWGGDGTFVVYLNDESIDAAMASKS